MKHAPQLITTCHPLSLPLLAAALTAGLAVNAMAQRGLKELPPVDAAAQKASFKLAPGLDINLFAQEPLIAKPIQMAWDEKGRLWVASSAIYPHIKPGQTQADKIVVLEDTDRDGVADKSTVFYEGLLIPTGILPGDGGAYVANSTELLFMKDTDGDGRADQTRVLLSGFGTEDTHHIIHSIKRGPDGCVYFAQSVYIHSRIETPYGMRELRGSGWWQYRPETGRLEVYSMGQVNPWGLVWDRWGQTFTTDGAYGEGINHTFPGATFLCLPNQLPRILKGLNPGQPKQCGLEIISGRHFPEEWQGQLITCDFRGHRVNRFALTPEGSGYSSRQLEDVVSSTHGSFRPVDVRMGPDGGLYLADWFNPIIQHGEVDFHDARRDREHGRIWRITAKGREPSPRPDYAGTDVPGLLELLKAPEDWIRIDAKQELKRRGAEAVQGPLREWLAAAQSEGAGEAHALAESLWTALSVTTGSVHENLAAALLAGLRGPQPSPALLAAGIRGLRQRIVEHGLESLKGPDGAPVTAEHLVEIWTALVKSGHPQVRLEAVNMLRAAGAPKAVEVACLVLEQPMDSNTDFALWLTCRELADIWLPAFRKGEITFGGHVEQISFALKAADRPEAVGVLLQLVQSGKVAPENLPGALGLVGALGSPEDLGKLLDSAISAGAPRVLTVSGLEALATAANQRRAQPEHGRDRILPLLKNADTALRTAAVKLAGAWRLEPARAGLEALVREGDVPAAEAVAALGGAVAVSFLTTELDALAPRKDSAARQAVLLKALITVDARGAAGRAAEYLAGPADAAGAGVVLDAYLTRQEGPGLLAEALQGKTLNPETAAAGVQKAGARGDAAKALTEVLTVAGRLQPVGVGMNAEELARMMAEVRGHGDAARGEQIYRRAALQCQTCHAIGAVGGVVGPDLLSIGASAPVDYLIDSLLEPSKKIKEGYATTVVNTTDGGVFSGFLVREDAREVLLRDAAGHTQSIPAAQVAGRQNMPFSLMPPGLTASLRRDEFVDLVRFMSELGKEGKYKVQASGVIRRWRLPQPAPEFSQVINREGLRALAREQEGLTWLPVYSLVGGDLPLEEIPPVKLYQLTGRVAQGEIDVTTAGPMVLKLADPQGLRVWVDGQETAPAAEVPLELPAGRHKVTVVIDPEARRSPLRVEVQPAPGSPARVVPVGGV